LSERTEVFTIITDLRFENELNFVQSNGLSIRIDAPKRNKITVPDHPSERFVQNMPVDVVVSNDGSLADLQVSAAEVAQVLIFPLAEQLKGTIGANYASHFKPAV
jgi:hypothetical protein